MRFPTTSVIPGHRAVMSPEPRTDAGVRDAVAARSVVPCNLSGSGFRAQASGLPRNDDANGGEF